MEAGNSDSRRNGRINQKFGAIEIFEGEKLSAYSKLYFQSIE